MSTISDIRKALKTLKTYDEIELELLRKDINDLKIPDTNYQKDPQYKELLLELVKLEKKVVKFHKVIKINIPLKVTIEAEEKISENFSRDKIDIDFHIDYNKSSFSNEIKEFLRVLIFYGIESFHEDYIVSFSKSIHDQYESLDIEYCNLQEKMRILLEKYNTSIYRVDFAEDIRKLLKGA